MATAIFILLAEKRSDVVTADGERRTTIISRRRRDAEKRLAENDNDGDGNGESG
jgi:hypothetical protein